VRATDRQGGDHWRGTLKGDSITGAQVHEGGKWEDPWNATGDAFVTKRFREPRFSLAM